MDVLLAALAGALVGGVASTFGALIVSRRALVREHRVRIYDELMPEMMEYVPRKGWPARTKAQLDPDSYRELWDPILRSAHVIGGKDAKTADEIYSILVRWAELLKDSSQYFDDRVGKTTTVYREGVSKDDIHRVNVAFLEAVDRYRLWLRDKLNAKL